MNIRIVPIITATILTFLGTVFCGALMTLPSVYASEPAHCEQSTANQHHTDQHSGIPCHGDSTHDHQQLGIYSFQKNEVKSSATNTITKVALPQPLYEVDLSKASFPKQEGAMHERSRHRQHHIQTRKKE